MVAIVESTQYSGLTKDEAFTSFYAEHAQPLLGFITSRASTEPIAEDIFADTFMVSYTQFSRVLSGEIVFPVPNLYKIARHKIYDHLREKYHKPMVQLGVQMVDDNPHIESLLMAKEELGLLAECMGKISPNHATLLDMFYIQDLSYEEIAQITGKTTKHVKSQLFKARQSLKSKMMNAKW